MVLLKDTVEFTLKPKNFKQCVFLAGKIVFKHLQDQSITQPIIGTFLTLRDLNFAATMTSLAKVDTKYL